MARLRTCAVPGPSCGGFSLIEMMVVVAIMALLAVLAVPALTSMQRQMALTRSGNQFADLAAKARQEALSRNVVAALVLMPSRSAQSGPALLLLELNSDGSWTPAGTWQILANTVQAVDSARDVAALPGTAQPLLTFQGQTVNLSDCDLFVFYPDARMRGGATAAGGSAATRQVSLTSIGGNSPNYYDLIFNTITSACQVVRP